jgi:hypothetical protein
MKDIGGQGIEGQGQNQGTQGDCGKTDGSDEVKSEIALFFSRRTIDGLIKFSWRRA